MTHSHVYCPHCDSIQPKIQAHMMGTDETKKFHNPCDILCGNCLQLITTVYNDAYHQVVDHVH